MKIHTLVLAFTSGLAASLPAAAQNRVDYTLNFVEVLAGTNAPVPNPNGILEPGEAARLSVSVSFTPAVGTTVAHTPPPPPGVGTMAGFGAMSVDLCVGPRNSPSPSGFSTWSFIQRAPGWALGDPGGVLSGSGGAYFSWLQAGQFVPPPMTANPANPIPDIWLGVWTPASYSDRSVLWQLYPEISSDDTRPSILIQYGTNASGNPLYVAIFTSGTYGSATIPMVPAPASLVALSALFLQRRRRGP